MEGSNFFKREDKEMDVAMNLTPQQYKVIQIALHEFAKRSLKRQKDYELMIYEAQRPTLKPTPSTKRFELMMQKEKEEFESVQQIIDSIGYALK